MITRNMLAGGNPVIEFKYTVITNASGSSDKKAALPVNLYGQTGVEISVDWGDGSTSVLKPSDYTASSSLASVHEYASAGTYQITASSSNWSNAYLLSCYADATISSANNANQPVYWWRRTLKSVDSPLPPVKGVMRLASASATSMTASDNDLGFLFHRCEKMTSIPANLFQNAGHIEEFNSTFYNCIVLPSIPTGLFDPCVSALNFSDCFRYCLALTIIPVSFFKYCTAATNMYNVFRFCNNVTSVPADLFRYNTLVTNMGGAFSRCDVLNNFTLCIGSPNVATVTDFIPNASNVTRIVCVPANSTTYNSFDSYKNASNNIIVSTDVDDCIEIGGNEEPEEPEIQTYEWKYTVNTQATVSGGKTTGVPFNLYGQTGIELIVDWGDNTTSTLTPSDYTVRDIRASLHTYETAGIYNVTIVSNDWENTYLHATSYYSSSSTTNGNDADCALYAFRKTVTSINTPYPKLKGIRYLSSSSGTTLTTEDNSFANCFLACRRLTSIPTGLFDNNPLATKFNASFGLCLSLQAIPSGLFNLHTGVTTFSACFSGCSSITSIPAGLFNNNTLATTFYRCFYNCSSLTTFSENLFYYNTAATTFEGCFAGCSSLSVVAPLYGLFDSNTLATNFSSCFYQCSSLQVIPSGLFDNNTLATNFSSCFYQCSSLQVIPSELFDNNTAATNFSSCFRGCSSVSSIPSGLFDNNTAATNFSSCFTSCTSIQSIPSGLFDNNTAATDFSYCFSSCSSLQSVPSGLFDNNTAVTTFAYCFYGCSMLQSIPSGLFDNNTAVTTFATCFYNCSSLASIPSGLFDNNTAVTNFSNCFYNCSSLQSIPSGLFDNNTAVTQFYDCFNGCTSLSSIPANLFYYNTAITKIYRCFNNCTSLNDFTLTIRSRVISGASNFVTYKANTTRIINVPNNSTTYVTFSDYASDLGLTIVGV